MRAETAALAVCALLLASAAEAQEPRPFRTEIYNGATRTVRYHTAGLPASEAQMLRERERLENEAALGRELSDLKREYVASERTLEPQRRLAQQAILALDSAPITPTWPEALAAISYGLPRASFLPVGYGAYSAATYPLAAPLAPAIGASRPLDETEGTLKRAMARAIAAQSSPDQAAAVDRSLAKLLPERGRADGAVRPVAGDEPAGVVLTLKSGETVRGVRMAEKGAWIIVTLSSKRQLRLRESEVVRIESGPGGIAPAGE